jgi:uncharacterized membrane protein
MMLGNISFAGWVHSTACIAALLLGTWNLLMPKGTATHRFVGRCYFFAMVVVNLSVFAIFHFDIVRFQPFVGGPNNFGIFHWEAVVTLFFLLLGVYAAPRQSRRLWAYVHPLSMLFTYYMLIGGLINELFVRVAPLRALALAQSHGRGVGGSPVVGLSQFAAMLIFVAALIYFTIRIALHRRGSRALAAPSIV